MPHLKLLITILLPLSLMGCERSYAYKVWHEVTADSTQVQQEQVNTNKTQSTTIAAPTQAIPASNASETSSPASAEVSSMMPAPSNQPDVPFIGKKEFNFLGGNGTGMTIKISKDGSAKIEACGVESCSTVYKGVFKPVMPIGDGEFVKIDNSHAYLLNSAQKVQRDCLGDNKPCVSQLY